jgi:hypothetical protein
VSLSSSSLREVTVVVPGGGGGLQGARPVAGPQNRRLLCVMGAFTSKRGATF